MKRLIQFNLINHLQPQVAAEASLLIRKRNYTSMYFKMLMFCLLITVLPFSRLFSNSLVISIPSGGVDQGAGTVTFDLSWENSWRNTFTTSANWDAAWVFIKWRDCTSPANAQFTHGLISNTLGDHNFNVLSGGTTFEPTLADGSAVGIDASPNNTGVMLRNVANPVGPASVSARITLKVTNLPASGSLDLRVFGIEMVFVPQGAYSLGDGNGTNKSNQSFASAASGSTSITISSEAAQPVYESTVLLGLTQNLTTNFPKGYKAFYIMKYEITHGQYVDFLNTSNALVQSMHYTSTSTGNRYTISNSSPPGVFSTTRPYRACNFLSWADVGTYLSWAALRPLTELEYEKACKGTAPVSPYDNAMGVAFSTRAVSISGTENGNETISVPGGANINSYANGVNFNGGDGSQGPLRGGIFATASTSSRNQTGASFYGVMDLSGNLDEYYISSIAGTASGQSANGLALGTGTIDDASGQFANYGWPSVLFPNSTVVNGQTIFNIIHRGGHWNTALVVGDNTAASTINVSNRSGGSTTTRLSTSGGRGGRSVTVTGTGGTLTYNYTGAQEVFTVPNGVTSVTIDAYGAQGGGSGANGGRLTGTLAVTPGQLLYLYVGQQGQSGAGGTNPSGQGSGGGTNYSGNYGGGGGSEVRKGGTAIGNRIIIAGGGGGGSSNTGGIGGGGTSGTTGFDKWWGGAGGNANSGTGSNGGSTGGAAYAGCNSSGCYNGGGGGGYTSGGGGGSTTSYGSASSGSQTSGGAGYDYNGNTGTCVAGGGGGGHWGGGGGYSYTTGCSGGGGGSSATLGTGWTSVTNNATTNTGNGKIIITW